MQSNHQSFNEAETNFFFAYFSSIFYLLLFVFAWHFQAVNSLAVSYSESVGAVRSINFQCFCVQANAKKNNDIKAHIVSIFT